LLNGDTASSTELSEIGSLTTEATLPISPPFGKKSPRVYIEDTQQKVSPYEESNLLTLTKSSHIRKRAELSGLTNPLKPLAMKASETANLVPFLRK
jgi:hypothetical protein